jgi:GH15 family glucan-1,4-alpha-glucosidase
MASSFHQLVSANGYTATIYDERLGKVTGFREHVYASVREGVPSRELACEAYFGLRLRGTVTWLTEASAPVARYLPGTGVIEAVQRVGDVEATTYLFAPFEISAPAAVLLLRVKNGGARPLAADDAARSSHSFHLGDSRVMAFLPIGDPSQFAESRLAWSLADLAPGAEAWVGLAFAYHPFGDHQSIAAALRRWLDGRDPSALVADELARWEEWHAKTLMPPCASADELALFRQQVALLRMGQVLEPDDAAAGYFPHGQIVASLPPGGWNIAWVRDGCVAIRALVRCDHVDEARDALEFMLKARAGRYQQQVGMPYQISVVRYFGSGLEESDRDANGPNIEYDGFGMFLDALDAYERATNDLTLAQAHWLSLSEKVADVLVALATDGGLLQADSSIWESHWDNGGRQHWTWTQVWAVVGLRAAEAIAARHGEQESATRWSRASETIRAAILAHLVDADGFLRGRLESSAAPEDAAVVEAFNRSVVDPASACATATLARLKGKLRVASGHGCRRNLGPSEYDAREWIFVDLRMATALRRAGDTAAADALLAWVTAQSRHNHDLIAENYEPTTADYLGAVPMIGFGAGAYVLALFERSEI